MDTTRSNFHLCSHRSFYRELLRSGSLALKYSAVGLDILAKMLPIMGSILAHLHAYSSLTHEGPGT